LILPARAAEERLGPVLFSVEESDNAGLSLENDYLNGPVFTKNY
jgi:hypothetical protein